MLNKVMIIGRLGADPEMKYTANGNAVTTFNVATSRTYTNQGERVEETEWFSIVAWNRLAETCTQYLVKGRQVYVEGRMQTRSWDAQDGQKRYRTELIANEVKFLGSRGDDTESGSNFSAELSGNENSDVEINPDDLPF